LIKITDKIENKEIKLLSICYFLNVILKPEYPLEVRKKELLRVAAKFQGFPEFSDIWGRELESIDKVPLHESRELLEEYNEEEILSRYQ
jgi:hypothetical protein